MKKFATIAGLCAALGLGACGESVKTAQNHQAGEPKETPFGSPFLCIGGVGWEMPYIFRQNHQKQGQKRGCVFVPRINVRRKRNFWLT